MKLIGIFNWYRPYIPNLSKILLPITRILSKKEKLKWEDNEIRAKNTAIEKIKTANTLKYPQWNKPFILETDACDEACGAVLKQEAQMIGIYSKKFNGSEINYTITEKEALAIVKALEHFRQIIFNSKIIIKTDNNNICFDSDSTKRIQRWKILMQEYSFELFHQKGNINKQADALSRLFAINTSDQLIAINWRQIQEKQSTIKDLTLNKTAIMNTFKVKTDERQGVIIPEHYSNEFLKNMHLRLVHPGRNQFERTICTSFAIKGLKEIIRKICLNCHECNLSKGFKDQYGTLKGGLISTEFNERISSDIMGPLKTRHLSTKRGNEKFYILTVTDVFSR